MFELFERWSGKDLSSFKKRALPLFAVVFKYCSSKVLSYDELI